MVLKNHFNSQNVFYIRHLNWVFLFFKEANSSDDSDDDYALKKNVLITELGENEFDSYDEDLEDEDRLVITPKKKKNIIFYEKDIYNEKDWDTDLEGI